CSPTTSPDRRRIRCPSTRWRICRTRCRSESLSCHTLLFLFVGLCRCSTSRQLVCWSQVDENVHSASSYIIVARVEGHRLCVRCIPLSPSVCTYTVIEDRCAYTITYNFILPSTD